MKNPILHFRKTSNGQVNLAVNLGKYDILKGVYSNSINEIKNNKEFAGTLITKTRESADMSESS